MNKKSYYRKITELLPLRFLIWKYLNQPDLRRSYLEFLIFFTLILSIFLSLFVALTYLNYSEVKKEHDMALGSFRYWEQVIETHPNFTDGYYNAALYAGRLGQKEKAVELIDKALVLDPMFSEAIELERQLTTDN